MTLILHTIIIDISRNMWHATPAVRPKQFCKRTPVSSSCNANHVGPDARWPASNPVSKLSPANVLLYERKMLKNKMDCKHRSERYEIESIATTTTATTTNIKQIKSFYIYRYAYIRLYGDYYDDIQLYRDIYLLETRNFLSFISILLIMYFFSLEINPPSLSPFSQHILFNYWNKLKTKYIQKTIIRYYFAVVYFLNYKWMD